MKIEEIEQHIYMQIKGALGVDHPACVQHLDRFQIFK